MAPFVTLAFPGVVMVTVGGGEVSIRRPPLVEEVVLGGVGGGLVSINRPSDELDVGADVSITRVVGRLSVDEPGAGFVSIRRVLGSAPGEAGGNMAAGNSVLLDEATRAIDNGTVFDEEGVRREPSLVPLAIARRNIN